MYRAAMDDPSQSGLGHSLLMVLTFRLLFPCSKRKTIDSN